MQFLKNFISSSWQTKFFIFTAALYLFALLWTTLQSYLRLLYVS